MPSFSLTSQQKQEMLERFLRYVKIHTRSSEVGSARVRIVGPTSRLRQADEGSRRSRRILKKERALRPMQRPKGLHNA